MCPDGFLFGQRVMFHVTRIGFMPIETAALVVGHDNSPRYGLSGKDGSAVGNPPVLSEVNAEVYGWREQS